MIIFLTHRSLVAGWVVDYIPHDLEEQTKVLLRLTMESPLTSNVSYDEKEKCTEKWCRRQREYLPPPRAPS
jgi:hypothetical protein